MTSDVAALQPGEHQPVSSWTLTAARMDEVSILRLTQDECGRDRFIVKPTPANCERVKAWLRGLGDGYILFDRADLFAKVEGPLVVEEVTYEQCLALGAEVETLGGPPPKP